MKLALIGEKLTHSYSAVIHDLFFEYTGIRGSYELVEIPDEEMVKNKIDFFKANGYDGINVTIPYKEKVISLADSISDEAGRLEAANTLHFTDVGTKAYNTDYFGFMRTLQMNRVEPKGNKWLVVGYGGGAKSVIAVLKDMGAKSVTVANRSKREKDIIGLDEIRLLKGYQGVVNTTPVGMYPAVDASPVDEKSLKGFEVAVDIVYNPLRTKFLNMASEGGLKTVEGLYMLVAQAVKAQEIWNQREFGNDIIDRIFNEIGNSL